MEKNVFRKSLAIGIIVLFLGIYNPAIAITTQIEKENKTLSNPEPTLIVHSGGEFNLTFFGKCNLNMIPPRESPTKFWFMAWTWDTSIDPNGHLYSTNWEGRSVDTYTHRPFTVIGVLVTNCETNMTAGVNDQGGYIAGNKLFLIANI